MTTEAIKSEIAATEAQLARLTAALRDAERATPWRPAKDAGYWYLHNMDACEDNNNEYGVDLDRFKAGNCYRDEATAKREARMIAAIRLLRNSARESGGGDYIVSPWGGVWKAAEGRGADVAYIFGTWPTREAAQAAMHSVSDLLAGA